MSDEPRPSAAAQATISNSTITNSTIHQETHIGDRHYHAPATWQPRWEPPLAEARELLDGLLSPEAPPITLLPSGARMPFAPNPHFVGRDAVLLAVTGALHGGAQAARAPRAAVAGLGGIGKTSVAVEIAHRYGGAFAGGVFWLSFADPAAIASEVAACGGPGLLDLHPSYGELKQEEQLALVREAWQRPIPRLLIFDNAEDPRLVQQWAPTSGGCRVLLTSRRPTWPSSLGVAAHRLDVLARPASVALLRDLAPRLAGAEAEELADELGDFPLALQLAGSYLAQFGRISAAAYLAELRSTVILAHPSLRGLHDDLLSTAHQRHVGHTFLVSYQRLDPTRDALALGLLARAVWLAPGAPIPIDLLLASADLGPTDAAGQLALHRLIDLGFVTGEADAVVLHRLIQAFVGAVMETDGLRAAVERALAAQALAVHQAGYPAAMQPLLPHLRWATRHMEQRLDGSMARLCAVLGAHDTASGAYAAARPLLEHALASVEQRWGSTHPRTAGALTQLAGLLETTGDYAMARPLYEWALAIREEVVGPAHPETAASLHRLANLLDMMGDYAGARPLAERALAIREQMLGPSHADTAASLNTLAGLFGSLGDYAGALPLYERALAIREAALGPIHPETAESLNDLAWLLKNWGDLAAARPLYERALAIWEQVLGPLHPDTAVSLNNLGSLLRDAGDLAGARRLFERALAIREQALGPLHPTTAVTLNNLGGLLRDMGEPGEARRLYERALTIREAALGPLHPETARSLHNVAGMLLEAGDAAGAKPLYERAVAIREAALGADHPDTALSLGKLARLYEATGAYGAARPLYARAVSICERSLGADHATTRKARARLQALLAKLKEGGEAGA
ncbi:MAG TPA: tetratricopeptide repeat protein [Herpetosiphonaceae bacterium]